ncbi:hypothetical protein JW826_05540 [Candidatus Woesearchaeota archaeon]|nr:hypothetical protein [Candidatus Woesearchaeota archaeon]
MKNKALILAMLAITAFLCVSMASAIVPNNAPYAGGIAYGYASYGSYPVNPSMNAINYPYESQPVRVGGFYGQNSAFLIGLKPGVYGGPVWNTGARNTVASRYYPQARVGGWFGNSGYYNLRPGTFVYGGSPGTTQAPNYAVFGTL